MAYCKKVPGREQVLKSRRQKGKREGRLSNEKGEVEVCLEYMQVWCSAFLQRGIMECCGYRGLNGDRS